MNTWTRRVTLASLIVSNLTLGAQAAEPTNPTPSKVNYGRPFEFPTRAALIPLPAGAVEPQGWLRDWCIAARDGYTGNMDNVTKAFKVAWSTDLQLPSEKLANWRSGGWPFEGGGYWFDGLVRLGYALHDEGLINQAKRRFDVVVDHMNDKGISFFWWLDRNDPTAIDALFRGKFDKPGAGSESYQWAMWANGLFGRGLAAYCVASKDPRAIHALEMGYHGNREWTHSGWGPVNLWPSYEAYTLTGNAEIKAALIECFTKPVDSHTWHWDGYRSKPIEKTFGFAHDVRFMESAGMGALGYLITGDRTLYDTALAWFDTAERLRMEPYGVPNGGFMETCSVNGYMWSKTLLLMVGGDGMMADQVERAFFNAAAVTVSRDFTQHVYAQGANCFRRGPFGQDFGKTHQPLCCTASINRFLGYFVTHQWMATYDNGLVATFYGPCRLSAMVGDGVPVEIVSKTDYPFNEGIEMTVKPAKEVTFPLSLRIPRWCDKATVTVNGTSIPVATDGKGFCRINRAWKTGDTIQLQFPMTIRSVIKTEGNGKKAVPPYGTVSYGPLLFALPIPDTTDENTPDPSARVNFALDIDGGKQGADMTVERDPMPAKWNWPLASPLKIIVPALAFDWRPTKDDKVKYERMVLPSTAITTGSKETITLIPYGCTRFRFSQMPVSEQTVKTYQPENPTPKVGK